jgi:hypothetical protein
VEVKYKLPEGCGGREESIESLLESEDRIAEENLAAAKQAVEKFLREVKGYSGSDLEIDLKFDVTTGDEPASSKSDIVIALNGKRLISITCSPDSLVSRERQALACARLLDSYQIPFAVITDGSDAVVLDTLTGDVIGEGMDAISSKERLEKLACTIKFIELPAERVKKEKMIASAFDAIGRSRL